ncbi:TetR/AcrR family transcriptional regulator [Nocardia sp. NPDC050406]|uniref:TetR/AcrR family transcriptional regulator n=1 Tax=Nocardia sp. NPDC050406 TaxID=3364318 RepID=UPI00378FC3B1
MSIRSRYHHGDLRSALLERAEATLRKVGVDGLSLRQLARDIGVSHAAPSRHFRDKQALLDELAASGFERLGQRFAEAATAEGPVTERLYGMARAYLRFAMDNPELLALMFTRKQRSTSPDLSASVQHAFAVPVALIASGQEAGEIVAGDPKRIGITCIAALQGVATLVGSDFTDYDADQLLRDMVRHLTDGLRPRP